MISFVSYDLKAPVDLFQQDYAHHLMRECHSGKGKFKVGSHAYFFREAQGAADYKYERTVSCESQAFDFFGK